ncbi:MAG TPA: response regulator [Candidatus Koribacter sp.]|jgi:signal transduction histidine kinase
MQISAEPINVLLVEDNPGDAELISDFLSVGNHRQFRVRIADRLSDAIKLRDQEAADVILLDLNLPDSNGFDTVEAMLAHAPGVPIIVLTGLESDLGSRAMRKGCQDYLVKGTVDSRSLARAIEYAVERRIFHERMEEAQKMEAIGTLAGGIAHDFNNILLLIRSHLELALTDPAVARSPELARRISHSIKATERAASLTHQLLAFGRKQVVRPKALNANAALQDLEPMLRSLLPAYIDMRIDTAATQPNVFIDPVQLEQIVLNLALNARDAMPHGGKFTVETSNVRFEDELIDSRLEMAPGPYVLLALTDTGCGIAPAELKHIFNPFFTTKPKGKGTGLGLSTVYGIVKQNRGYISVYSELGTGTSFKIYLPLCQTEVIAEPHAPKSAEPVSPADARILLVEDEEANRCLLAEYLTRQGFRVFTAGSAEDALLVARERSPIDLLVTDMILPGMNGKKLAECLTALSPQMAVLYISGYTENAFHHQEVLPPGTAFLQKPFMLADLKRRATALIVALKNVTVSS